MTSFVINPVLFGSLTHIFVVTCCHVFGLRIKVLEVKTTYDIKIKYNNGYIAS